MDIELRIAEDKDISLWDGIVEASPYGTLFHTWKWLKITERHTKSKLYPIIGLKGSTVIGIYPLFYQKRHGITGVYSPPPATSIPYLGPIIIDYDIMKQSKRESTFTGFQRSVDQFIFSKLKPSYVLVSLIPDIDPRPFIWTGYNVRALFDYGIDLSKGIEKVWQDFDKSARDHIKKIENMKKKEGEEIELIHGSGDELDYIYEMMDKRYEEQNKPVTVPYEYLVDLYENFRDNLKIFILSRRGKNIGGILVILYKNRISFWIGAAKPDDPELKKFSPNEIIHWEALKWAYENGFTLYEEFGANIERLCRSKSKYNPHLTVRFTATKYSSFIYQYAERLYRDVLKKVYGVFLNWKNR